MRAGIAITVVGLWAALGGCRRADPAAEPPPEELLNPAVMLTGDESENVWSRAVAPRPFEFPRDHGAHEGFRIEWWYYTGNLAAEDGREFGYQLTFFRTALHPQPPNPSRWAVRDLYTAHFAISDLAERRHVFSQRNNRAGVGWAGAETERCRVWNGDWKLWLEGDAHRLVAQDGDSALDLTLVPAKPATLHGEQGLSRKGPSEGNASYYYSLTRLSTSGTLRTPDRVFRVHGDSWMDHEFSSSFLEPGQAGWDWFSIQLNDGCELMLYQMRREGGQRDPLSSGTFIDERGQSRPLAAAEFDLQPAEYWQSPRTGGRYPLRWRVAVPALGYDLQVRAAFESQEMHTEATTGLAYWEGSTKIAGRGPGGPVAGRGYLELTGYSGTSLGFLLDGAK